VDGANVIDRRSVEEFAALICQSFIGTAPRTPLTTILIQNRITPGLVISG